MKKMREEMEVTESLSCCWEIEQDENGELTTRFAKLETISDLTRAVLVSG